jgi:inosine/xanthosine triphosphate pyrophosphatase family protein
MTKLTYSSLVFASSNRRKLREYRIILSLPDLKLSEIRIDEHQRRYAEDVVSEKIEVVKKILTDTPFFVEHTALEIDAWGGFPGGFTSVFMKVCTEPLRLDTFWAILSSNRGPELAPFATDPQTRPA